MLGQVESGSSPAPPVIRSERLDLVLLSGEAMDALITSREDLGGCLMGFSLPRSFPEQHDLEFLRFRRAQLQATPDWGPWLVRAMVRRDDNLLVGTITFHGPPGINSLRAPRAVEVGYTIEALDSSAALMYT